MTMTTATDPEPFYGRPRPSTSTSPSTSSSSLPLSCGDRITLALHSAITAYSDPTRADAVAILAEITGPITLQRIHKIMINDETGKQILIDRPVVSKATIPYEELIANAPTTDYDFNSSSNNNNDNDDANITFGQAYGSFLKIHGFDPDERDDVKYVEDETLAYIMLRYRQCHDYFHTITGLPPTVLGELGLKWYELFQTGLPVAALSCTVGSLRVTEDEQHFIRTVYLPWAIQNSQNATFLMNVYYEKEFDTPLHELRRRLNLQSAPPLPPHISYTS